MHLFVDYSATPQSAQLLQLHQLSPVTHKNTGPASIQHSHVETQLGIPSSKDASLAPKTEGTPGPGIILPRFSCSLYRIVN